MKIPRMHVTLITSSALAALFLVPPAWSAPAGDDEEKKEEEEEAEPIPEEEKDAWFYLHDAEIHTGTGTILRDAELLAKNGKIVAIGYGLEVPGRDYYTDLPTDKIDFRVETLDAQGMRVYPGIVAINSVGLAGAASDYRGSIDPFSQYMVLGLAAGITSTGQGRSAVKLKRYVPSDPPLPYDFDGIVLRETTFESMSYTSGLSRRSLREKLVAASDYLRAYRQWEIDVKSDKELKEPSKKGVDSGVLSVLQGEMYARFRADERSDLLAIARLAQEFGFRPIIDGCREGWTVAEELGRAGAMAILTARERRDKNEALVREGGSSIENAAKLTAAGVPVAIVPASAGIGLDGIVGRDIIHLPVEVAFAIRGGLSEELALASITTVPARMMGIGHRVGTLEIGKDCDLIVADGDLLHYQTFVQYTVVDGQLVYDKEAELYYAHIRPRPEVEVAPEAVIDAGENPVEEDEAAEKEKGDDGGEGEEEKDEG